MFVSSDISVHILMMLMKSIGMIHKFFLLLWSLRINKGYGFHAYIDGGLGYNFHMHTLLILCAINCDSSYSWTLFFVLFSLVSCDNAIGKGDGWIGKIIFGHKIRLLRMLCKKFEILKKSIFLNF